MQSGAPRHCEDAPIRLLPLDLASRLGVRDVLALGEGHAVVLDGVVGAPAAAMATWVRSCAGHLRSRGVGRSPTRATTARSDGAAWLSDLPADRSSTLLEALFAALGAAIAQEARISLGRPTLQLARYGPGASYDKHLDAFRGGPTRRITAILYLNPAWTPSDGGELRVWAPGGPVRISPLHDRVVLFRSDIVAHEVCRSAGDRWAVTGWYGPPSPGVGA